MSPRPALLLAPAAALLAGLVLGPSVFLVRVSLCEPAGGRGFYAPGTWTLDNYAALLHPDGQRLVAVTAAFGLAVAGLTLGVGYTLALFIDALSDRWRTLALAAVLLPKAAGPLAVLFGLQQLLPRGPAGAVVAEAYLILPYAVLVLAVRLRAIDPLLAVSARGLGASRWQAFRRVTLPLSAPGLLLAGQLALMWGLGAFLGPLFVGGPAETTLAVEAHRQAFEYGRWPQAAATAVGLLVLVAAASLLGRRCRP